MEEYKNRILAILEASPQSLTIKNFCLQKKSQVKLFLTWREGSSVNWPSTLKHFFLWEQ